MELPFSKPEQRQKLSISIFQRKKQCSGKKKNNSERREKEEEHCGSYCTPSHPKPKAAIGALR